MPIVRFMRPILPALLSASLVAATVAAAAPPSAAPLSLVGARAGADGRDAQRLTGGWTYIALAIMAVAVLVIAISDNGIEEFPDSP